MKKKIKKKKILLLFVLCQVGLGPVGLGPVGLGSGSLFAYVPQETLFDTAFVAVGSKRAQNSSIDSIVGSQQFAEKIFQNEKPVVLHIFSKAQHMIIRAVYRHVAHVLSDKVDCLSIDIDNHENFMIVRAVMGQLGVGKITVPFFLLFKQRSLHLPPVAFPHLHGSITKKKLHNLTNNFITHIKGQFFSQNKKLNQVGLVPGAIGEKLTSTDGEKSTLKKIVTLSKKMNKWLVGLQHVSTQEARAYGLSRKGNR